jgi:MAP3K TRAFs-binding domain
MRTATGRLFVSPVALFVPSLFCVNKDYSMATSPFLMSPSLPAIITAARAGALDHAWKLFFAGGFDRKNAEPGAIAVKARLLKDAALRSTGGTRQAKLLEAADVYAEADALSPQPYTQINIAALRFLAGDRAGAAQMAQTLLGWLARDSDIPETPYYLAATKAEALLLCDDQSGAKAALERAVALDPDGWADRASTLRQMRLIETARGADADWLTAFSPPASLHFAGHLGISEADMPLLRATVECVLKQERIGFGYGALAAGADIVIAQALLARGAELHLVLPMEVAAFKAQSVLPFGEYWSALFDDCIKAASSVRIATSIVGDYEPIATALAADLAMGAAALNARQLESKAVQLLVIDEGAPAYGNGTATARDGHRWAALGHPQQLIRWPRSANVPASGARSEPEGRADRKLLALLHIAFDGLDRLPDAAFADALDQVVVPFRAQVQAITPQPVVCLPAGNAQIVAFDTPEAALDFARALLAVPAPHFRLRISGHYAIVHKLGDAMLGGAMLDLARIAAAALPGIVTVSEALATALYASAHPSLTAEHIGEQNDIRLFALSGI